MAGTVAPKLTDEEAITIIDEILNRGGYSNILIGDLSVYSEVGQPNGQNIDAKQYEIYKRWAKAGYITILPGEKLSFQNEWLARHQGFQEKIRVAATQKALQGGSETYWKYHFDQNLRV